jgi:serine/threonine protein kinase
MAFRDDGDLPDGLRPLGPEDPTELGGHHLLGVLGQGGMGTVYLGRMRSGRRLAVKVVRSEYAHDPEFGARFQREVDAALKVRGPRTAMLVDADLDHDPPWLATEYVPGPTLAETVKRGGPLDEAGVRDLVRHLAEGLADVHRAGMVHRDLKPANVILGPTGPCVIDMGIARAGDATSLTATGALLGTPVFMAPEQALGRPTTPATDVWSLGAVAYFAATGRMAFGTARADVMYFRVVHEPPDLEGCPASLRPLVEACLAKDPTARPSLADLAAACAAVPTAPSSSDPLDMPTHLAATAPAAASSTVPLPPRDAPARPTRRRGLVAALAAAGLVVVSGTGVGIAVAMQQDDPPVDPGPNVSATDGTDPTTSDAEAAPADETSTETLTDDGSGETGELDPCLVGTWEQTAMTNWVDVAGEDVTVTGWSGRTLEFFADGTAFDTFDDAEPVSGWNSDLDKVVDTWSGFATYAVRTQDDTILLDEVDYSTASVERTGLGDPETYQPEGPDEDISYECTDYSLHQFAGVYDAWFERRE